jgi:D-serine deaminase-like pyridoxal phosphate-dependent protein
MSSNYPLPSKASLVQQFVGKTLKEIPLPAAVIDIAAAKRNCKQMSNAIKELGFDFVPLVNVHKVRAKTSHSIKIGETSWNTDYAPDIRNCPSPDW